MTEFGGKRGKRQEVVQLTQEKKQVSRGGEERLKLSEQRLDHSSWEDLEGFAEGWLGSPAFALILRLRAEAGASSPANVQICGA